jgi:phosphopantothenoylcysteine decarboxylase/phosphopantothenate--cysteine ligase
MRYGIADTPVTSVLATAVGLMEKGQTRILVAPTMHGDMHNGILQESLEILASKGITLIPPRDDYGKHNLPDSDVITAFVSATLSTSPIRNKRVLVTAGSTPTYIDDVRFISNKFRGHLGIQIANELCLRGVEAELVLGPGSIPPPAYITTTVIKDYEDYKSCVLAKLRADAFDYGVFAAAVADYKPKARVAGKIPSTGLSNIALEPTAKVIDLVQKAFPTLKILTFKFQLDIAHEDLIKIAAQRVRRGHIGVIANRGEERGPNGEHIAHLVDSDLRVRTFTSKKEIAIGICDYIEEIEIKRE